MCDNICVIISSKNQMRIQSCKHVPVFHESLDNERENYELDGDCRHLPLMFAAVRVHQGEGFIFYFSHAAFYIS